MVWVVDSQHIFTLGSMHPYFQTHGSVSGYCFICKGGQLTLDRRDEDSSSQMSV